MRHFNCFLIVCVSLLISMFTFHQPSHAQFDDIPHNEITVDLGLAGDRGSQSNSLTAVLPVSSVHGWVGVHALKTTAGGDVLSEVVKAHAQGGHRFGNFGVELFVDAERNLGTRHRFNHRARILFDPASTSETVGKYRAAQVTFGKHRCP